MKFRRLFGRLLERFIDKLRYKWLLLVLYFNSLCFNTYVDSGYIADTLMEPMFWFVDQFTQVLGPIFVTAVICLLLAFVLIAYIIGLTYWSQKSTSVTLIALVIGHWLLINVIYHYYKALTISPGYPPDGATVSEVVSICKKCISPKPARTHHCSVCNRCILKMDHHCPWLNNCVGHYNHRYFFMFCVYTWFGTIFVMLFGYQIAYDHYWPQQDLTAVHSNSYNISTETTPPPTYWSLFEHKCIIFEGLASIGIFFALGALIAYHSLLITKGETCIERHINKKESVRLAKIDRKFFNPYNFGPRENWKRFLGLNRYEISWINVLLPSNYPPIGDGIHWITSNSKNLDN